MVAMMFLMPDITSSTCLYYVLRLKSSTTKIKRIHQVLPMHLSHQQLTASSVGTIVACCISRYSDEEHQLCKVVEDTENIEVEWMVGSYAEP